MLSHLAFFREISDRVLFTNLQLKLSIGLWLLVSSAGACLLATMSINATYIYKWSCETNLEVTVKKKLSGHHIGQAGAGAGGQQEDKP